MAGPGRPKTGGRRRGTPNRRNAESARKFNETSQRLVAAYGLEGFAGDAHALLMVVYKNAAVPMEQRLYAATHAIPYEKRRLASIVHTGADGGAIQHRLAGARDELTRFLAGVAERLAGTDEGTE